jgi:hypothetical protein
MKIKGTGYIDGLTVIANVSPQMNYSRGMTTQCANAELIIKAVNNHDRLVNELEHVVKSLEAVSSLGATTPIIDHAKQLLTELKS